MKAKLLMVRQDTAEVTYIHFSGGITENNDLPALAQYQPIIVINTKEIEMINSCGVRDWLDWISARKEVVYFIECSVPFMVQVNTLSRFIGTGIILSFYAPFYCPECDRELHSLITINEAIHRSYVVPICQECDVEMELDVSPEAYFKFISSEQIPKIPPPVRKIIEKAASMIHVKGTSTP